jgi:hypothetical protein
LHLDAADGGALELHQLNEKVRTIFEGRRF